VTLKQLEYKICPIAGIMLMSMVSRLEVIMDYLLYDRCMGEFRASIQVRVSPPREITYIVNAMAKSMASSPMKMNNCSEIFFFRKQYKELINAQHLTIMRRTSRERFWGSQKISVRISTSKCHYHSGREDA
jgi:hypothetical protein